MLRKEMTNWRDWLFITAGILIMTAGIYFFKFPNHFSTGGVTGIAIVLGHYIPDITPGTLVTIINIILLILGFAVLGKSFGIRTVYASLLMSGSLQLLEIICPMTAPMTSQPLLELLFAVGLPAVGSAILFNLDASSGGTDILAMILRKYTALNIGIALLCSDIIITVSACFAFGMETGLFSILGLIIKSLFMDTVMDRQRKYHRRYRDNQRYDQISPQIRFREQILVPLERESVPVAVGPLVVEREQYHHCNWNIDERKDCYCEYVSPYSSCPLPSQPLAESGCACVIDCFHQTTSRSSSLLNLV